MLPLFIRLSHICLLQQLSLWRPYLQKVEFVASHIANVKSHAFQQAIAVGSNVDGRAHFVAEA